MTYPYKLREADLYLYQGDSMYYEGISFWTNGKTYLSFKDGLKKPVTSYRTSTRWLSTTVLNDSIEIPRVFL